MWRRIAIVAVAAVTACFDGRPRPGKDTTAPPVVEPARLVWFETQPRVVVQGRNDSVDVNVGVSGTVTAVHFQPRTGLQLPLRRVDDKLYTLRIDPALLLFGYRTGDLHHVGGILQVTGEGPTQESFLGVNVKDATVPPVTVSTLAPTVQASAHVVNIRADALNVGGEVNASIVQTLYAQFPDDYMFIAVIEQVQSPKQPFYLGIRNDITGLGIARFDRGATYGSGARLEGILHFPNAADFDLGQTTNLRELSHRWMNSSTQSSLSVGRPLWPLSSLAAGVLGWSDPQTHEPLLFPFDIIRQPDGTHVLRSVDQIRSYNDLELYMMGLLPPDSVRTHFVFADQNQKTQVRNNGVLRGAVDSVRISDIVARDGARVPSSATARRDFRIATIVLSRNRMLSLDEMAFFDYFAARGEQKVALPYSDGINRGTTLPFFVATGGRATLTTTLRTTPSFR